MKGRMRYLQQVGGRWRYVRAIPARLQAAAGGRKLWLRVLGTADANEALAQRPLCDALFDAEMRRLKALASAPVDTEQEPPAEPEPPPMGASLLRDLASFYLRKDDALRENVRRVRELQAADIGVPQPGAGRDNTPTPPRSVAALIDAYKADRAGEWSQSTADNYRTAFAFMAEALGPRKPAAKVTREDARAVRDLLQSLPRNRDKDPAFKGMTGAEAAEANRQLGKPSVSVSTINNNYLANMNAAFAWARREGWI